MAGRGKNAKMVSNRKKSKVTRSSLKSQGNEKVTMGAIRRLARRGGVRRMSMNIYDSVRNYIDDFLGKIVKDACSYSECRKAATVTAVDVIYAMKKNNRVLYGYGI